MQRSGDVIDLDDCEAGWCRFEACLDGNMETGAGMLPHARIVSLASGEVVTFSNPEGPVDISPSGAMRPWIGNLYRQGTDVGSRSVSHGMQAEWTTAGDQWIGSAQEIEGCSGAAMFCP